MFWRIRFQYYLNKTELMTTLISDIDDKSINNYWNDHDYKTFIETEYTSVRRTDYCDKLLKELQADDPISTYEIFKYVDKCMDEHNQKFIIDEEVSDYERKVSAFRYFMARDW